MRAFIGFFVAVIVAAAGGIGGFSKPEGAATGLKGASRSSLATRATRERVPPRISRGRRTATIDPVDQVSSDRLLGMLTELTEIRPYSGWRLATTAGESAAIELVRRRLADYNFLRSIGMAVEQQPFRTYKGVEFHASKLELTVDGVVYEAPAEAQPGHRDRLDLALRFDSDGSLNDSNADPVVVQGAPLVVLTLTQLNSLTTSQVQGRVVFLDFALVDRSVLGWDDAVTRGWELLDKVPAGVVLVTEFSNRQGESHGAFAGDVGAFIYVETQPQIPILNLRIEDLEPLGIVDWDDLDRIQEARLTWDTDLHEVGESANLVARIPGEDPTRAVVLGAHIDSPNAPGALDDGSGSVTLLEVARVLNLARTRPPTDLYLVWFGSEEIGLYGSANFVAANSELLDRTLAMLQMDGLGHPLDGISNFLALATWPYGRFGDDRLYFPDYVIDASPSTYEPATAVSYYGLLSDNSCFAGYNVPNALLDFTNPYNETQVHYANHWHDPYDTVELAALEADAFGDMAKMMVTVAIRTGVDDPVLRPLPTPDRRALFVGSHTECTQMSPTSFIDLGMTLGWEGFDVDLVPYGTAVTSHDLETADVVVALPVHDYPSTVGGVHAYDESWTTAELDALEDYVERGGLLLITNSAHRLKFFNTAYEENEDWSDVNALAERFGVSFNTGRLFGEDASPTGSHALTDGVTTVRLVDGNGVRFDVSNGQIIARAGAASAMAVVEYGAGEVLVIADLSILGNRDDPPPNMRLWRNLAHYAR